MSTCLEKLFIISTLALILLGAMTHKPSRRGSIVRKTGNDKKNQTENENVSLEDDESDVISHFGKCFNRMNSFNGQSISNYSY